MKKILKFLTITLLLAACIVAGYWYYQHNKFYPSTDDAYVQANIVNIAPQVSGKVSKIFIQDNQRIKKGEPLFYLDPKPFKAALNEASAKLKNTIQQVKVLQAAVIASEALVAQREAELSNAEKQSKRILTLVDERLYPAAEGDKVIRNVKVAKATLKAAKSQLNEAKQRLGNPGQSNAQIRAAQAAVTQNKIRLQYTKVYSPANGFIAKFTLRKGSDVTAYQQVFAIIDDSQWWVSANFKETDLNRIRPGQHATIKIDMYPDIVFKGRVESISPGSGASFALLPPEQATGNWVKVTQRFPVRIAIPKQHSNYPLRIGASCTVTVDTRSLP